MNALNKQPPVGTGTPNDEWGTPVPGIDMQQLSRLIQEEIDKKQRIKDLMMKLKEQEAVCNAANQKKMAIENEISSLHTPGGREAWKVYIEKHVEQFTKE